MRARRVGRKGWIRAPAIIRVMIMLILVVSVIAGGCCISAFDPNVENGVITISYDHEDKPIAGAEFKVYRVCYLDEKVGLHWTEVYEQYNIALNYSSAEDVQNLAMTLQSYLNRDNEINPDVEGKTDENGKLVFEGLKTGMYLIVGKTWSEGYWNYRINPMIITLPFTDDNSELNMNEKLAVKDEGSYYKPPVKPPETEIEDPDVPMEDDPKKDIKVRKVWDILEGEVVPSSITVDVMRDGQKVDEITLNKSNGFEYTLKDLPQSSDWDFIESKVPEGYQERIVRDTEKGIVNIINTQDDKEPNEDILKDKPDEDDKIPDVEVPMDELPDTGINYVALIATMTVGIISSITGIILIAQENRRYEK